MARTVAMQYLVSVLRLAWGDLRHAARPVLLFSVTWVGLQTFLWVPLLSWVSSRLIRQRGQWAISNFDLAQFFLSPAGIAFGLLVVLGAAVLQLGQQAGLQILAREAQERVSVAPWRAVRRVLRKVPRLLKLAVLLLIRLSAVVLPGMAILVGLYFHLPGGHDPNFYLATQPPEWRRTLGLAGVVVVGVGLTVGYLLLRWMLALPHLVATGQPAIVGLQVSWRETRGRVWSLAVPLFVGSGLWLAVSLGLAAAWVSGSRRILDGSTGGLGQIAFTLILVQTVTWVLGAVSTACGSAISQFTVARIYREVFPRHFSETSVESLPELLPSWKRIVLFGLGLALAASLATTLWQVGRLDLDGSVQITAHRGSSRKAPENSLSAVRQAAIDGADYAEIDVQTTRDGRVVLWHDADLMRAIRDPRKIGDCTWEELRRLEVGGFFSPAFAGERMATLEEAIAAAGPRMRLNIELKYNRRDPTLAPRVAQVLQREGFLDRCVVTSLEASELEAFHRYAPSVPRGLIVTAALGSIARLPVEFLSVNSRVAQPAFLAEARKRGKAVHVWTVNDRESALRFVQLGADNLITDEPALMVELRRELEGLDSVARLALALRQWSP